MIEQTGDIWLAAGFNDWPVITTNGSLRRDGSAVMGRGIALEAAERFPQLPILLGERLKREGNQVFIWFQFGLFTFPTKELYHQPSPIELIENGCKTLVNMVEHYRIKSDVMLPRLGCGNGRLKWKQVRPIVEKYLKGDQFIVFTR